MVKELTYALITGGSRGLGKAIARELARRGMPLLLVARNAKDLDSTAVELRKEHGIHVDTLVVDICKEASAERIREWCRERAYPVNILVNNAGIGGKPSYFDETSLEYNENRITLNITALMRLSHLFLPELKANQPSYILNIGSLSAYFPGAYKTIYSASKAFVYSFSLALNEELRGSGVRVTVLNPNGVRTNAALSERIDSYPWFTTRFVVLDADRIARIALDKMFKGKAVVVPGIVNRLLVFIGRVTPKWFRESRTARVYRRELDSAGE